MWLSEDDFKVCTDEQAVLLGSLSAADVALSVPSVADAEAVPSMLWEHQKDALALCSERQRRETSRVLVRLPPGTGKTEIGAQAAIQWVMGGSFRRALISVPTGQILANFYRRLVNLTRLPVAVERAHQVDLLKSRIVVASQPTLWSRLAKFGDDTLCVIDECHHANLDAPENLRIIERFRHVVGLSATPWSNGCTALFSSADTFAMTLDDAQRQGFVCDYQVLPWIEPCGPWGLVFCETNAECERRSAAQPGSSWIGVSVAPGLVSARVRAWKGRQVGVLYVNRMLLEGFDEKRCGHVWIARECESQIMIVQMVGRALRAVPGKRASIFCSSPTMAERVHQALQRLNTHST